MAKYMQLVMVNVHPGGDDSFNNWLDNHHIPEVCEAGGFTKCHRFELAPEDVDNPRKPKKYMHLYELDTDETLEQVKAKIDAKRHLRTPYEDGLDRSDMFVAWYKAR